MSDIVNTLGGVEMGTNIGISKEGDGKREQWGDGKRGGRVEAKGGG
jgi:hypothetical protein